MVEDEAHDATLVEHTLKDGGFEFSFKWVDTECGFVKELEQFKPSLILSDHGLPAFDGFTALALAQKKAPDVPFIFVTGSLGEEMTIQALKSGATDFVLKHRLVTLPAAVHRALRQAEFRQQRRQAQEELLSSEERYRSLVELSPDALFVLIDERMIFVNSSAVKLLGAASPDQLVHQPVKNIVHPEHWKAVRQGLRRVTQESKPIPFVEYKLVHLDRTPIDVELAAAPLVFTGKPAAQVIAHDIREHKRAEAEIRRL